MINGAKYHLEPIGLNVVVDQVLQNLHQSIQEHQAQVDVEQLPEINGNSGLLVHYFQNMISNSLKYKTPGINPKIRVYAESKGKDWNIAIQDNGIGIDPAYFNEIFKPFKRLHRKSEIRGSGIGLATCKRIAQIHHGKIWLESTLGAGSTFFLEIAKKPS